MVQKEIREMKQLVQKGGLSLSEYRLGSEKWAKKNALFFMKLRKEVWKMTLKEQLEKVEQEMKKNEEKRKDLLEKRKKLLGKLDWRTSAE